MYSLKVFEYTLNFLSKHFYGTPITVIYIPSTLSCYTLISNFKFPKAPYAPTENATTYRPINVTNKNIQLASYINNVCSKKRIPFFNATNCLKQAANIDFVHGPKDYFHLNQLGCKKLSGCIVQYLKQSEAHHRD